MLVGRRAFEGETITDVLAAVVRAEPDWTRLPADTPHAFRRLLRRCLTKDPSRRLRDIGGARLELEEAAGTGDAAMPGDAASAGPTAPPASRRREIVAWSLAAVALLAAAWAIVSATGGDGAGRTGPVRFSFNPTGLVYGLSEETSLVRDRFGVAAISPDGSRIAYAADPNGTPDIYVLDLATGASRRLYATPEVAETVGWAPCDEILFMKIGQDELLALNPSAGEDEGEPRPVATLRGASKIAMSPDRRYVRSTSIRPCRCRKKTR